MKVSPAGRIACGRRSRAPSAGRHLEVSPLMAEGSKDGKESEDSPGGTGGD